MVYLKDERGMADSSRKNHLAVLRSFFQTVSRRMKLPDPTSDLDEVRFHQKAPKRSYLTKREADILLSTIGREVTNESNEGAGISSVREERRRALAVALAARDHAAFSAMIYAGLRIEESTALTLEDLSFVRGEEEVRVARGKGNKERVVPMSPKLGRSLKRYLKVRDELVVPAEGPLPGGVTHLFLNEKGTRVTENTLRRRLYSWVLGPAEAPAWLKEFDRRLHPHISAPRGGMPDVVAWDPDRELESVLLAECKGPKEKNKEAQEDWVRAAIDEGVPASNFAAAIRVFV